MNNLRETERGFGTLVELSGKLDAATTPAIESRLLELIQEGKKQLVIDFASVSYLASSGLRMLLVVLRQVQKLEGRLLLCGLTEAMVSTLEVTGFLPYFQIETTPDAALQKLEA